jgi:hypothetical protein
MDFISNFIVKSPYLFLGLILVLALAFFISSMYLLFRKAKIEDQIQNAIKQQKLAELKAHEEYKAQFKSINQVRRKFKCLKHSHRKKSML